MNNLRKRVFPPGHVFQIVQSDLTLEKVDAIVNAANARLQHGGGVAGAIVRRGGTIIQKESDQWIRNNGLATHSRPAFTSGGRLTCQFVIHAVGPIWGEGEEDKKLSETVIGSLKLATILKVTSIAFPAISTGIFGYPKDLAAEVMFTTIRNYFVQNPESCINTVRLVLYDQLTIEAFI